MLRNRHTSLKSWIQAIANDTQAFTLQSITPAIHPNAKGRTADYYVTIVPAKTRRRLRMLIETKARITPQEAIAVCTQTAQRRTAHPRISAVAIACPNISDRVADICRENGVGYLDAAGNCDIRATGLAVHVEGRPNVAPDTRPLINPFAPKASRVARVLLCQPRQAWQVQQLANQARISLGLAFKAKQALIQEGYIAQQDGKVTLRDPRALLESWVKAYRPTVASEPLYVMAETSNIEYQITRWCDRQGVPCALAGLSAAWRLAPMVRYKQACVCIQASGDQDMAHDLLIALDAKPVETGSNLLVQWTTDESLFFDARTGQDFRVLSPVQTYLDLSAGQGRAKEAAEELFRRILEPSFQSLERQTPTGKVDR